MNIAQPLALTGLLLSFYAVHVAVARRASKRYRPLCDVSDRVSCSKAFLSPHGTLFRLHNGWIGAIAYLLMFILASREWFAALLVMAAVASLLSIYLAFITYVEMRNFCIVCTAVYAVNFTLLAFSYRMAFP